MTMPSSLNQKIEALLRFSLLQLRNDTLADITKENRK